MAGINDVKIESNTSATNYHIQPYTYQEYYGRLHSTDVDTYRKIITTQHPEWLADGGPKYIFLTPGPVIVTHETNSSIILNAWSGALMRQMEINKTLPPLLVVWLYKKEQIQALSVGGTMESDIMQSNDVFLLNGKSQVIYMPKMESCERYNISFDPAGKQKTKIKEFSTSPCADVKQSEFILHEDCPELPQLNYLELDMMYLFILTIADLVHFPKLETISLTAVPLAYNGMENKLLCSMDNLKEFYYQNSFQNLKQFPSQIFNCSLPLLVQSVSLSEHAMDLLPAYAFQAASQNLKHINLTKSGLKYIDKNAFSGMINLLSILISGNPLNQMPAPYALPPSNHLDGIFLIDNQSNGLFNLSLIAEPFCLPHTIFVCDNYDITLLTGQSICCNDSRLEIFIFRNMGTLRKLDENMFTKCTALKYLSLPINALTYFALPPLNGVEYLDLACNDLNDSNPWSFLLQHPILQSLNIANNRLTAWTLSLKLQQLRELDLSHNQITYILSDAFQNLSQLEYIDLGYNKISDLAQNSFTGLAQLTGIVLRNNELSEIASILVPMTNRNFSILDISYNTFTSLHMPSRATCVGPCTPQSVVADSNQLNDFLLTCHSQQMYDIVSLAQNNLTNFYNIFPDPLKSQCHIKLMDASANNYSLSFEVLDTKVTHYINDYLSVSVIPLTHYIDTLIMQHCHITRLAKRTFIYFNLGTLDLQYNLIKSFEALIFPSSSFPVIDITKNPLYCSCETLWLKYQLQKQSQHPGMIRYITTGCLNTINRKDAPFSVVPDDSFLCPDACTTEFKADCLRAVCYKMSDLTREISAITCISSKNTTAISDHFMRVKFKLIMSGANLQTLKLPYLNNTHVNHLNLSSNNISSVPDFTFLSVPFLQSLVLSNNTINHVTSKTFQGLGQLLLLDLSGNILTALEEDTFKHLYNLQSLSLERNMIKVLNPVTFDTLDELISLTLHDNPWSCICNDTMWHWLLNNQDIFDDTNQIRCHSTGEPVILSNRTCDRPETLKQENTMPISTTHNTHKLIIGSIAGLLAITLAIVCVVFKYRFYIAVLITTYAPRPVCMKKKEDSEQTENHGHAIFLVYDDQDTSARAWIKDEFVARLVPDWPVICYDKDFLGGFDMADNIQGAVSFTDCAVVLITEQFLDNHWSRNMFEAAYMSKMEGGLRNPYKIIPILTDNLSERDIITHENCPADLIHLLKTHRILRTSHRLFWQSLVYLLPPKSTWRNMTPFQPGK